MFIVRLVRRHGDQDRNNKYETKRQGEREMVPVQKQRKEFLAYFLYWFEGEEDADTRGVSEVYTVVFCNTGIIL